jgi:predicted transglutaminase-like cysteine proteinase
MKLLSLLFCLFISLLLCSCADQEIRHSTLGEIVLSPEGLVQFCISNPSVCSMPESTPQVCDLSIDGTPEKCIPQ